MEFNMKLVLKRQYFPEGTNGKLSFDGMEICSTIELPWKDNISQNSCIPEGEYLLKKRFSDRFQWHIEVQNVPQRSLILFHPANYALSELKGCIAPVVELMRAGVGTQSRKAFQRVKKLVYSSLDKGMEVRLKIES
jgi:hypothetical protein